MGVPVLSRAGKSHRSRVGAGILASVGLNSLVKDNASGYVATAIALAGNPAQLVSLRGDLRQRMLSSPLMDASTLTRELEKKLMQSWEERSCLEGSA